MYIVLRRLELNGENVSVKEIVSQFTALIDQDVLLMVGEDGVIIQE